MNERISMVASEPREAAGIGEEREERRNGKDDENEIEHDTTPMIEPVLSRQAG